MRPSPHEFGLGPGHDAFISNNLRSEAIQRRRGREHPGPYFQRNVTGNGPHEPNVKIPRDCLNSMMKQAVRHHLVQQRGNDPSVKEAVISLELRMHLESCPDGTVSCRVERQVQ